MRCLSSLFVAAVAGAEESLFEDDAVQLLQVRSSMKKEEADLALMTNRDEALQLLQDSPRPDQHFTEAQSLAAGECDIWGGTRMFKTFRGYTYGNRLPGWLLIKDDNGVGALRGDLRKQGLYAMAQSKDERFKAQVFSSGWSSSSYLSAMAFKIDDTIIRVLGPEPRPLEDTSQAYNQQGRGCWTHDPDAVLGTWANHKIRIKVGDQMYSQFDMPLTIPGTNIELTQHSWNMRPNLRLQSGFIIDNKDGFRATIEQISSNADTLWMNVNLKFAPDNVPEPWTDDLCGRGNDANPMCGDAQGEPTCGPDGSGDWSQSFFTAEDHEQICYAANRKWGEQAAEVALCPGGPEESYNLGCRACSTVGRNLHDCRQDGDESAEGRWKMIEWYAQERMVKGSAYGICSMPPEPPPEPTSEELCEKSECDHARGEQLCLPVKAEGEDEGGMYKDCLMEYCAECLEEAAQEFIGELVEAFPEEEGGDGAAAVGDPHLTTNGGRKFDLKGSP